MPLRDNPGAAVSAGGHVALLAAMLLSFSHDSRPEDALETIPVEMMTSSQFNQIMKGEKTGKLSETPRTRAEKRAETAEVKPVTALAPTKQDIPSPPPRARPVDDPGRAEEAKPEPPSPPERPVQTAKLEPAQEPRPEPRPKPEPAPKAETKPEPEPEKPDAEALDRKPPPRPKPRPEAKAEPQKAEPQKPERKPEPRKAEPKFKPDELAKLLEEKKPEERKPAPKPKTGEAEADLAQKFDVGAISRLLNKEAPQRSAAAGRELSQTASLGAPTASAAKMSPSLWAQLDGLLQDQYRHCWNFVGVAAQQKYVPQIHVRYALDGSLVGQPELLNPPTDPNLRSLADSAMRAARRCNPLRIPAQFQPYYEQWKGRVVRFDPEDML
ncbi:cell envelope biogenesis protein TolA [Methylocella sp.]|uniref:cell envelope biogenesis protein TolA n=1 Tax=Methylocella sp. TaxID=1978226 RepID=UPI0037841271